MRISGAIFDMDGTLIDSLMLWDILWEEFTRRYALPRPFCPSAETDKAIRTVTLDRAMDIVHQNHGIGPSGQALFQVAVEVFLNFYNTRVTTKPGVLDLLDRLAHMGVKMVIATAADPIHVNTAMAHCGFAHHIGALVTCREVGAGKHDPAVFERALEVLGTPKEETWVFEDSTVALTTAHNAGFPTVAVYDAFNPDQDEMRRLSDIYIDRGEALTKCLDEKDDRHGL